MATLADKLIQTIEKDIEGLEQARGANSKEIRKECNMIKKRIADIEKLSIEDGAKLQRFKEKIDKILKIASIPKHL
ncbi:MAG: hypothetical protein KAG61_04665 [Bacteriovoracaceae bacterium]|nr:hypothetical protein [Bacteriovoracaceae bacterium]